MTNMGVKASLHLQAALRAHATAHVLYQSGEAVFERGSKCKGVFLVTSGTIKLFLPGDHGGALMERAAMPGCVLGLPSTVGGNPYSLTAEATERSWVLRVSRSAVMKLMQSDTVSGIELLGLLSGEVRTLRTEMAKRTTVRQGSVTSASAR
jgi:CRP-like cAMP-binding protein